MAKKVTVYGSGCKKCRALHEAAVQAAREAGLGIEVGYVTDPGEIALAGVMSVPALEVDGRIVSSGRVLGAGQVKQFL